MYRVLTRIHQGALLSASRFVLLGQAKGQPARRSARKEFYIRMSLSRTACFNSKFDSLARLANVFGQQRAILDALEYVLGFLAIRRRGVAHICNFTMHLRRHRLA